MGDTFESIANWCQQGNVTVPKSIDLWDGTHHYRNDYNTDNDHWEKQSRKEDQRADQLSFLQQKAWPIIASTAKQSAPIQYNIIETGYSKEHSLICIEKLKQGYLGQGDHKGMPPTRELYYLNPAKDYICQRRDEYRHRDAPWQQDKSWCQGVDPNRIRPDATIIIEVNAYGQTDEMKWYQNEGTALSGNIQYEIANFMDGKRTISDIRDAVSAEFRPVNLDLIVHYVEDLVKIGLVNWEK